MKTYLNRALYADVLSDARAAEAVIKAFEENAKLSSQQVYKFKQFVNLYKLNLLAVQSDFIETFLYIVGAEQTINCNKMPSRKKYEISKGFLKETVGKIFQTAQSIQEFSEARPEAIDYIFMTEEDDDGASAFEARRIISSMENTNNKVKATIQTYDERALHYTATTEEASC